MTAPLDRLIRIHEDEWAMRSLHPIAAREEVEAEINQAAAASLRNRTPDGVGWTELHIIESPRTDFGSVDLDLGAVEAALGPLMPRVHRFYANAGGTLDPLTRDPWGSYEEDALCFGLDEECYLKLDFSNGRIAAIWFECRTADGGKRDTLVSALRAVDALTRCVLADHWLKIAGAVGDATFLDRYADLLRLAALRVRSPRPSCRSSPGCRGRARPR